MRKYESLFITTFVALGNSILFGLGVTHGEAFRAIPCLVVAAIAWFGVGVLLFAKNPSDEGES